jgi:molybdate transport system substrate-binding protein
MKVAGAWRSLIGTLVALVMVSACGASGPRSSAAGSALIVAAASDLRPAFEEIGDLYEADHGVEVTFSFGSSGQLAQQILQGAPFDVFASANEQFIDDVIAAGNGVDGTKTRYALGRLALWSGVDAEPPSSISDLGSPRFARVAIANPQHAPYGLAARQALEAAGIYGAVRGRLVFGQNVSDAQRIVRTGNADVGIIALSLAMAVGGNFSVVPATLHEPLVQTLVVIAPGANEESARAFAQYVVGPRGREVLTRFGFEPPPDSGTQ